MNSARLQLFVLPLVDVLRIDVVNHFQEIHAEVLHLDCESDAESGCIAGFVLLAPRRPVTNCPASYSQPPSRSVRPCAHSPAYATASNFPPAEWLRWPLPPMSSAIAHPTSRDDVRSSITAPFAPANQSDAAPAGAQARRLFTVSLTSVRRQNQRSTKAARSYRPKTGLARRCPLRNDLPLRKEASLLPHGWDWPWDHLPLARSLEAFVCLQELDRRDSATEYGRVGGSAESSQGCSVSRLCAGDTPCGVPGRLASSDVPKHQRLLCLSRRETKTIGMPRHRDQARSKGPFDVQA